MSKGLGSNVGDAKWAEANEKKERLLKFAAETKQRMQSKKQNPNIKEDSSSYAPASHTFGKPRPAPVQSTLLNKQNLGKIPKANSNISDDLSIYDNYAQPSIPGKDGLSRLSSNIAGVNSPLKQQKKGKQAEPTAREKAL